MGAVSELRETVVGAAARVGPAVVGLGRGWSLGSGVVVADGQVLTSAHNLRREETAVTFQDGHRATGTVAGVDPDLDIALLAVDTGSAPAVAWDPEHPPPPLGEPVVALANPGGRGLRATLGLVSSEGRSVRGARGRRIEGAIEHTAPLPRGSSGGPLVDLEGGLLGLHSLRLEGGFILAVPATAAMRERVRLLGLGQAPPRRRLGVAVAPPQVARRMRRAVGLPERPGLLVRAVERDSPAEHAGVKAGDLLAEAGGRRLEDVDALYDVLDALPAEGGALELTVVRGSDERDVTVELGQAREPVS